MPEIGVVFLDPEKIVDSDHATFAAVRNIFTEFVAQLVEEVREHGSKAPFSARSLCQGR